MLLGNKTCDSTCKYHGLLSGSLQFCACVSVKKILAAEAFLGMFWKKKSDWSNSPQPPIIH